MYVGLELEEIHMAPGSLNSVMDMATRSAAYGAWELAATLEIDMKVQLLIFNFKLDSLDIPWLFQTKRYPE
jgi:hypothetical protein